MTTATDRARRCATQIAAGALCCLFTAIAQAQLQNCELDGKPVNLGNGSTTAGLTGLVEPPRAAIGQQPCLLQFDAGFGDPALNGVVWTFSKASSPIGAT